MTKRDKLLREIEQILGHEIQTLKYERENAVSEVLRAKAALNKVNKNLRDLRKIYRRELGKNAK